LDGHLKLVCSADESGRSFPSEQSFSAPFHLSKPYWDGHALIVQVINSTAGLFSGDRLRSFVQVARGARLHLTTPSASRVHTMQDGWAGVEQVFHVAAGGWLEYSPAPLIPQRDCRYRQVTRVDIETGGEGFFLETLSPGRVAHGEAFAFAELDWTCELRLGPKLVARERFRLRPGDHSVKPLQHPFPTASCASGYLVTERVQPESPCWEMVCGLNGEHVLVGASRLARGVWCLRLLARDSVAMRRAQRELRRIFSAALPEMKSAARNL
jgi:urease accessory protein